MSSGSESEVRTYFGKNTLFGEKNMFWGVYFYSLDCIFDVTAYGLDVRTLLYIVLHTHIVLDTFNSTIISRLRALDRGKSSKKHRCEFNSAVAGKAWKEVRVFWSVMFSTRGTSLRGDFIGTIRLNMRVNGTSNLGWMVSAFWYVRFFVISMFRKLFSQWLLDFFKSIFSLGRDRSICFVMTNITVYQRVRDSLALPWTTVGA